MLSDFDRVAAGEVLVLVPVTSNKTVDESDVRFSYVLYSVIAPIVFGLIIVLGILDNACVVAVVALQRKMRTAVNLLLLNLAIGDLAFLTTGVPFIAYHYAADNWRIADIICPLSHYVLDVTGYVTVYTLVIIAAVRFVKLVCSESDLARGINKSAVTLAIGALWVAALATNWPVFWFYRLKDFPTHFTESLPPTNATPYRYCGVESVDIGRHLFVIFFLLAYVLPLIVTCLLYCLILRHLQRRWRESSIYHRPSGSSLVSSATGQSSRHPSISREHHWRAARLLGVVVIVFTVSRLPLHVQLLLSYVSPRPLTRIDEVFRLVSHCLAYSNSLMNPLIYSFVSYEFRRSFRQLLCCCSKMRRAGTRRESSRKANGAGGVSVNGSLHRRMLDNGQGQEGKVTGNNDCNQVVNGKTADIVRERLRELIDNDDEEDVCVNLSQTPAATET